MWSLAAARDLYLRGYSHYHTIDFTVCHNDILSDNMIMQHDVFSFQFWARINWAYS